MSVMAPKATGSSPLTRGKLPHLLDGSNVVGLIPAHAGKTDSGPRRTPAARAHPRSRGENRSSFGWVDSDGGSSPLTRGKRVPTRAVRAGPGLIPAHAGKTQSAAGAPVGCRAHPRSRGENGGRAARPPESWGSSPLTRGKPAASTSRCWKPRLIPAHAGKTRSNQRKRTTAGAHPRSRGENVRHPVYQLPG